MSRTFGNVSRVNVSHFIKPFDTTVRYLTLKTIGKVVLEFTILHSSQLKKRQHGRAHMLKVLQLLSGRYGFNFYYSQSWSPPLRGSDKMHVHCPNPKPITVSLGVGPKNLYLRSSTDNADE